MGAKHDLKWLHTSGCPQTNPHSRGGVAGSSSKCPGFEGRDSQPLRLSEICLRWHGLPVYSPTFQSVFSSTHIHQVHECCSLPSSSEQSTSYELFGRLAAYGLLQRTSCAATEISLSTTLRVWGLGSTCRKARQCIPYLGLSLNSIAMRAHLLSERSQAIMSSLAVFKEGRAFLLNNFQKALGLMEAVSALCRMGLLHMQPVELWLKACVPIHSWHSGSMHVLETSRADMLSKHRVAQGEWRLLPQTVNVIWTIFGPAEVDLFASAENTHHPLFFSLVEHTHWEWMNSLPCEYLAPSTVQDQGGKGVSSVNITEMAHTALVPGPAQDTVRSPMAHSSGEGSPLSSEWLNLAPQPSCGPFTSGSSMEPISVSLTSTTLSRQRFYLLTLLSNELATCMLSQSMSPAWTSALTIVKSCLSRERAMCL